MPTDKQALKDLQKAICPCFGTLKCTEGKDGKFRSPLNCPIEPDCANKWLAEYKKVNDKRLRRDRNG